MALDIDVPDAVELSRTEYTKTYRLPDGHKRLVCSQAPVHYFDGQWKDISLDLVSQGDTWVLTTAPYTVTIHPTQHTVSFSAKDKTVHMRLIGCDGRTPKSDGLVEVIGSSIWWREVEQDFDIEIRIRTTEIEIYKVLKTALAPTSLLWAVDEPLDRDGLLLSPETTFGRDNLFGLETKDRSRDAVRNWKRHCVMEHRRSEDDLSERGRKKYTVEEVFTGQVVIRDKTTRIPTPTTDVLYPVEIDTTFAVDVSGTASDGWEYFTGGGLWYSTTTSIYMGAVAYPAWRFQNVTVPNGATINTATVRYEVWNTGTAAGTIRGQDVDNAPAWTNNSATDKVSTMAQTAASAVLNGSGTAGQKTFTITDIVQEIVDRAGWASGNAMRIAGASMSGTTTQVYDISMGSGTVGRLEIDYTEGGGGGISPGVLAAYFKMIGTH